jgi:hypothetical protein
MIFCAICDYGYYYEYGYALCGRILIYVDSRACVFILFVAYHGWVGR